MLSTIISVRDRPWGVHEYNIIIIGLCVEPNCLPVIKSPHLTHQLHPLLYDPINRIHNKLGQPAHAVST